MSGSAQARTERVRAPQAADSGTRRLQAVSSTAAAGAEQHAQGEHAAQGAAVQQAALRAAAPAKTFRLVQRSDQREWGSEMARIQQAWPDFTAAHEAHVHAVLVNSTSSNDATARRYVCEGAGTQLRDFSSVADLQHHISQQAVTSPEVRPPKVLSSVSKVDDRSSQQHPIQQVKQQVQPAGESAQQRTAQAEGHKADLSQSQKHTLADATQRLQNRVAIGTQQHASAGAMQPQPLQCPKHQAATVAHCRSAGKLWQRRMHLSHKPHHASAVHAASTHNNSPMLLPVRDVAARDQSGLNNGNPQPLLQHASRPALVQQQQHDVQQQAQSDGMRKVEYVQRGNPAWPELMRSIQTQWPSFSAEMEARLEFVRVALRLSGKAKGQGYKTYKVAGIQQPCRSVTELQIVLAGVGKEKSVTSLDAPMPPSSATQSSFSNLTRSVSGPCSAMDIAACGDNEKRDMTFDMMRHERQRNFEIASAGLGSRSGGMCDCDAYMHTDDLIDGVSRAGCCKRTAIQSGMMQLNEPVSIKRIKLATERMSDDADAGCTSTSHARQACTGIPVTKVPPVAVVPDCEPQANNIPIRTPKYLLRRMGRRVDNREQGSTNRTTKGTLYTSSDISSLPFGTVDNGSGVLCAAGAAFVYSGGKYPFSNIARCSADIAACQPAHGASACVHTSDQHDDGNTGIEDCVHCCASDALDNQSKEYPATCRDDAHMLAAAGQLDLVAKHKRLVHELEEMTRQRDAAVLLAREFHKQIVSASEVFGVLSLMEGA